MTTTADRTVVRRRHGSLTEVIDEAVLQAKAEWIEEARDRAMEVAFQLPEFCANEVWRAGLSDTANRRAHGGVLRDLAQEGCLVYLGKTSQSWLAHKQPIGTWRLAEPEPFEGPAATV